MKNRLGTWARLATVVGLAALAGGCGDDSGGGRGAGGGGSQEAPLTFDPTSSPFGKTYAEWGGAWWKFLYEVPGGEPCLTPDSDPTGASCALGQDSASPVFFLAGTSGGSAVRTECTVPSGKALFFPILTYAVDNGGVAPDDQLSDAELRAALEAWSPNVDTASLQVEVDGTAIPDLTSHLTGLFPFSYSLPPEPNRYSCFGLSGVTGEVAPAYGNGYFVMLQPLDPGAHTVRFAGRVEQPEGDFLVDVTYELVVQ